MFTALAPHIHCTSSKVLKPAAVKVRKLFKIFVIDPVAFIISEASRSVTYDRN
jgi:hypothetical protein